jgi:hypothetical protein
MTFKFLFDYLKIKKWREKYYTYEYCKNMVHEVKILIKKLDLKRQKYEEAESILKKEYFRLVIERLSKI